MKCMWSVCFLRNPETLTDVNCLNILPKTSDRLLILVCYMKVKLYLLKTNLCCDSSINKISSCRRFTFLNKIDIFTVELSCIVVQQTVQTT